MQVQQRITHHLLAHILSFTLISKSVKLVDCQSLKKKYPVPAVQGRIQKKSWGGGWIFQNAVTARSLRSLAGWVIQRNNCSKTGARERNFIWGGKILINAMVRQVCKVGKKISDTLTCDSKPLLILGSLPYPSNSSQF